MLEMMWCSGRVALCMCVVTGCSSVPCAPLADEPSGQRASDERAAQRSSLADAVAGRREGAVTERIARAARARSAIPESADARLTVPLDDSWAAALDISALTSVDLPALSRPAIATRSGSPSRRDRSATATPVLPPSRGPTSRRWECPTVMP